MAQGCFRYRCFLPDLTGFTVPPCTGPNYQQSTSPKRQQRMVQLSYDCFCLCLAPIANPMAERGGFEPPVPLLGVHTISSRAPSTARSPLRSGISSTCVPCPTLFSRQCLQNVSTGRVDAFFERSTMNYQGQRRIKKLGRLTARYTIETPVLKKNFYLLKYLWSMSP